MRSVGIKKYKLPDSPGVYIFLKKLKVRSSKLKTKNSERILYIGKATSLKDRVKSYFSKNIAFARSLLIEQMVEEADSIKTIKTDSVLEALILEANLIKKYKPKYNIKEKDDKSFNFVVITDEEYPRVFSMRGRDLQANLKAKSYKLKAVYGPYTSGGLLKEALRILRKIFPFRGEKISQSKLDQEIGLSPKETISRKEYAKTIKYIKNILEGKNSETSRNLRTEMKRLAKAQEFELAERVKRQIFALEHINDIALLKEEKIVKGSTFNSGATLLKVEPLTFGFKIEAYDVAHISGSNRVGVMVALVDGEPDKNLYRKFKVREERGGDTTALKEILERRLDHSEWPLPKLIVLDGGKAQRNTAERVLTKFGYQISVVAVVKGMGHKPKNILGPKKIIKERESEILLANNEAHRFALKYHREKRGGV